MLNKIKLINILNELQVTPQGITPEKVKQYFEYNLDLNNNEFDPHSKGWKEYWEIKKQYIIKYNLKIDITSTFELIKQLSKPDLFKFYNEMRALVRKYVGKEILSELQVVNPSITLEKVQNYYINNILNNNKEFAGNSPGWKEYEQICEPYCKKYKLNSGLGDFHRLSKPDLIQFYNEMRALVRKHIGKEILSELQIKKPPIKIPKGWSEIQLDAEDIKEGIIYWFSAPMEGWDKNHEDFVKIIKKDNEFIIEIIYAFGDLIEEDEKFTSLKLALNKANEIMKEISEDWENEDDY